jgi:hypothetical protein
VTSPVTGAGYPARVMQKISETPLTFRDSEWGRFPGGELEGKRPKVLCPGCRTSLGRVLWTRQPARSGSVETGTSRRPLCFQCYRAELDRGRALKAAGELDTASVERFQTILPFEPVNRPRLDILKAERSRARLTMARGVAPFEDRRRHAQIAARHALQRIAAGPGGTDAIHAAELQLPESWLPFVVSR